MERKNFGEILYSIFLVSGKWFYLVMVVMVAMIMVEKMEEKMEEIMVVKRVVISCERFQYVV